jgi:uncharacterized delta-60 repeat protein
LEIILKANPIMKRISYLPILLLAFWPYYLFPQPDPSFGNGGGAITPLSAGYDSGYGLAIQPDGKIVVAGERQNGTTEGDYDIFVARYNPDGALDASFGSGGVAVTAIGGGWDLAGSVLVQPDGKIVACGGGWNGAKYRYVAVRYHANGTHDQSFGSGGIAMFGVGGVQDNAWGSALQPNGKIILTGPVKSGGNFEFGMARLNADGSLDDSFGNGGKVITPFTGGDDFSWSVALQADGKVLLGGRTGTPAFALARYNSNGALDNSFGVGGKVVTSIGGAPCRGRVVMVQPDGKILLGGNSTLLGTEDFAIVRYNADGSLDPSFGVGGIAVIPLDAGEDVLWDMALEPGNGKIVLGGYGINPSSGNYDFALVRLKTNGAPDQTFGNNGILFAAIGGGNDFANNIEIQSDGKIMMTGAAVGASYDVALARFLNTVTSVFSPKKETGSLLCYPNPFNTTAQVQFELPSASRVLLTVHDFTGKEVARLADERLPSGKHECRFEAGRLPPGIYLVRLQAEGWTLSHKATLIR